MSEIMHLGNISAFAQLKVGTSLTKALAVLPAQLVSGHVLLPPTQNPVLLKPAENRIFLSLLKALHASPPNEPRVTAGVLKNTLLMVDSTSSAQVVGCSVPGAWLEQCWICSQAGVWICFPGVMNPYPVMQEMLMLPTVSVGKIPAELESLNPDISFQGQGGKEL